VTLLILLLSVAVLEYVVRRPTSGSPPEKDGNGSRWFELEQLSRNGAHGDAADQSLGNLGQALEQFGRGAVPQNRAEPVAPPKTPETGDGKTTESHIPK